MRLSNLTLLSALLLSTGSLASAQTYQIPPQPKVSERWRNSVPKMPWIMPLYEAAIPNSTSAPDEEHPITFMGWPMVQKVSRPTITAYLPAPDKSIGSGVIIFPGGGYSGEALPIESTTIADLLQNRGIAAFIVKYRLPSDVTMKDKSIGPLQDAQQAVRLIREHAADWGIDPTKVGVMGFSAGGHLAATVGTHFAKSYIPNDNHVDLRPDFMILVYPVITMMGKLANSGSRDSLLGKDPPEELTRLFSDELQVTEQTPPALLLHAEDDHVVDVDNSIIFFQALRRHKVPAQMMIFAKGDHGFFLMNRDQWFQPTLEWMTHNGWAKP